MYSVIIKMKPLQKSFHMVLFVLNKYVVLKFKPKYYGGSMVVSFHYKVVSLQVVSCEVKSIRCKDVKSFR